MDILGLLKNNAAGSGGVARDRLKSLLVRDRAGCSISSSLAISARAWLGNVSVAGFPPAREITDGSPAKRRISSTAEPLIWLALFENRYCMVCPLFFIIDHFMILYSRRFVNGSYTKTSWTSTI